MCTFNRTLYRTDIYLGLKTCTCIKAIFFQDWLMTFGDVVWKGLIGYFIQSTVYFASYSFGLLLNSSSILQKFHDNWHGHLFYKFLHSSFMDFFIRMKIRSPDIFLHFIWFYLLHVLCPLVLFRLSQIFNYHYYDLYAISCFIKYVNYLSTGATFCKRVEKRYNRTWCVSIYGYERLYPIMYSIEMCCIPF